MRFDVGVVGAGPAGAWLATLLARRGARVALFDPSHPREKPCGGGVTGRALALLEGVAPGDELAAVQIRHARFLDASTGASATVPLDPGRLVVANRTHFDGLLLSAARDAGAHFIPERVTSLERRSPGYRLKSGSETFDVSLLIGADGTNSFVRRSVDRPFRREQLSIATGYFAQGVSSEEIVVEMTADPAGYIWSFPRPDHLAIGICTQADRGIGAGKLRTRLSAWMATTGIAEGARLSAYSWPIPSLSSSDFRSLTVAGPDWFTIGDAAGLVDPITREGIFFALQSAAFAAEAIVGSVDDRARHFSEHVQDEIGADLAHAARLKAGFFRPRFTRLLLEALNSSATVRRVMSDLVAGTQSYRTLSRRLAHTCELKLAWRLLTTAH